MERFDLAVIGSGPGGYRAAVLGALRGLKVAIVERGVWGGTCLNRGCVPKKAWYQTAKLVAANADYANRGLRGQLTPDLEQAWRHQRDIVATVRRSYIDYLKRLGVTSVQGAARFVSSRELEVGGARIRAEHTIIATGSRPFIPAWIGRVPDRVLTTDDLFDSPPPPGRRVALIGSGVIGTEMVFILSMLGLDVLWLTQSTPLARTRFSNPAKRLLSVALDAHGLRARSASRPRSGAADADGVVLELPNGTMERVDWVLLGAGRVPNVEQLGLDAAGVAVAANGFIDVDDAMKTSAAGIYAIGDCADPAMTSNHALAEASIAVANVIVPGSRRRSDIHVPEVVYSAVELARFGLSEEDADERGFEPATGFSGFETSPAALAHGEPRGFARIVADHDTGRLLGAEAAGAHAGEWLQALLPVSNQSDALASLAAAAWNHPSMGEEWLNAVETLAAKWGLGAQIFTVSRRPEE